MMIFVTEVVVSGPITAMTVMIALIAIIIIVIALLMMVLLLFLYVIATSKYVLSSLSHYSPISVRIHPLLRPTLTPSLLPIPIVFLFSVSLSSPFSLSPFNTLSVSLSARTSGDLGESGRAAIRRAYNSPIPIPVRIVAPSRLLFRRGRPEDEKNEVCVCVCV